MPARLPLCVLSCLLLSLRIFCVPLPSPLLLLSLHPPLLLALFVSMLAPLLTSLFLSRVCFWCVPSLFAVVSASVSLCALSVLSLLLTISSLQRLASSIWIVTPHSFVFAFSRRRFRCRQDDLTDIRLNQSDVHRCEQAFICSSDQVLKCVTETLESMCVYTRCRIFWYRYGAPKKHFYSRRRPFQNTEHLRCLFYLWTEVYECV